MTYDLLTEEQKEAIQTMGRDLATFNDVPQDEAVQALFSCLEGHKSLTIAMIKGCKAGCRAVEKLRRERES